MNPEWGHFALILAGCVALCISVLPFWQSVSVPFRLRLAQRLGVVQCAALTTAMVTLMVAFYSHDWSVVYVVQHSHQQLPWYYRLAAVWGGHEGSFLLWVFILSIWTVWVMWRCPLPASFQLKMSAVLGMISAGFLMFVVATSNPFLRYLPWMPRQGNDLNPLLQDPGLVIHPPLLYMGYVGFAVAFAMAVAALWEGRLDQAWARWARPWTLLAWSFLTYGIVVGSWWAYRELGWGGWWFWDPVENASLMPWLAATALLHSLMMAQQRDRFKAWTVWCAICAFSMSLLGTFLVRSGVLVSVHAFAVDPQRGVFMLLYLAAVIGGALCLFALRAPQLMQWQRCRPTSREHALWANNSLLMVMLLTVLLGTLYPILYAALGWGKISVGAPYFNAVMVWLAGPLLWFMGIAVMTRWQQSITHATKLWWGFGSLLAVGLVLVAVSAWALPWRTVVGVVLALWIIVSMLYWLWQRRVFTSISAFKLAPWGMVCAHTGVAILILGISVTVSFGQRHLVALHPGEWLHTAHYDLHWQGIHAVQGPNYRALQADIEVWQQGHQRLLLHPQQRVYTASGMNLAKTAIDAGIFRDLYVALGHPMADGAWSLRVYEKPLVRWIWAGGVCMALGGVLAAAQQLGRRRRRTDD